MKAYRAHLREIAEAQAERSRQEISTRKNNRIKCDIPLRDQIIELMASMPPAQSKRAWSMEDFRARLKGRFHTAPSAGEIGTALKALGWVRIRDWSAEGEGRRYWLPPENPR